MEKKRNGFGSSLGFILASAGSAVGLGNIWGFPFKVGKYGGAAFVLVYILFALLLGIVGMTAEMFLGRRAAANPVSAFRKINGKLGSAGLLAIAIPFFIVCYYAVLGGYTIRSSVSSLTDIGKSFAEIGNGMSSFMASPWLPALCTFIFLVLSVLIIMGGVQKGIEKASKILMPVLFIILLAVMIYSLCLGEGVKAGLDFYILKADFKALGWDGVAAAMGQVFFSMSLGMGIMISYGSYAGEEINLFKSAVQISLIDTAIALMAGLAIFPAAYHFMEVENVAASEVGLGGFALMFKTLPQVFASLGVVGGIVGCFFFLMVTIAAITSVVSLIEVVTQFIIQAFGINRKLAAVFPMTVAMIISVLVSLSLGGHFSLFGFDLLTFFDEMTNTILMPVGALVACLCVGWFIPKKEVLANLNPKNAVISKILLIILRFVTPVLIVLVEISGIVQKNTEYAADGLNFMWIVFAAVIFAFGVMNIYYIFLENRNCGCNADELAEKPKKKKA